MSSWRGSFVFLTIKKEGETLFCSKKISVKKKTNGEPSPSTWPCIQLLTPVYKNIFEPSLFHIVFLCFTDEFQKENLKDVK